MTSIVLTILFALHNAATVASDVPRHRTVEFEPVTIGLGCTGDTPSQFRVNLTRSRHVPAKVSQKECLDRRKVVERIVPMTIGVGYNNIFETWLVVVQFSNSDSDALSSMTTGEIGARLLIIKGKEVIVVSELNAPLQGTKLYITAESESAAKATARYFERDQGNGG